MSIMEVDDRRRMQEYFDDRLRGIGERALEPISGEDVDDYALRAIRKIKKELPEGHPLRGVNYGLLDTNARYTFLPQILQAKLDSVNDPKRVPFGELKEITTVDPKTGVRTNRFIGQDNFCRFFGRPGRWGRIWNDQTKEWVGNIPKAPYPPL
jgi:hypothetical protein